MLIPYLGETGAMIVYFVMLFIVAPLSMLAFVRWLNRPVRPSKVAPISMNAWRRVDQPWSED